MRADVARLALAVSLLVAAHAAVAQESKSTPDASTPASAAAPTATQGEAPPPTTFLQQVKARAAEKPAAESSAGDRKDKKDKKDKKAKKDRKDKDKEEAKPSYLASFRNGEVPPVIAAHLDHNAHLVDNAQLAAYLRGLIDELLVPWGEPRPTIHLVVGSSPAYYAEANEGGLIFVDSGLLTGATTEAEIVGVLAHELSHHLLGHLGARSARDTLALSMETGGTIAAAAEQKNQGVKPGTAKPTGDAKTIAESTYTATTLWRDVMAPSFNREQEREADKLAVDLMKAAGFEHSALSLVFSKLTQAEAARSERLQYLHDYTNARLEQDKAQPAEGDWTQVGKNLTASFKQQFVTSLVDSLAERNVQHDTPDERQAAMTEYVQATYPGRRAKVARDSKFDATLKAKGSTALLAIRSASTADDALQLLAGGDVRGADKLLASIGKSTERLPPNVALARASSLAARNKPAEAIAQLQICLESPFAPAEAYTALAGRLAAATRIDEAVVALDLGGKRIGRWSSFLPDMVGIYRTANNTPLAEQTTMRCADEDRSTFNFGKLMKSAAGAQEDGLYPVCVQRLGYDPVANQAQQAPKPVQAVTDAIGGLFGKDKKKGD